MDIFGVLTLVGGLALFLYGMSVMGTGLEKISGGRLERILEKLTSNPFKAVFLGMGVTAIIQSSSATTVMVVGFVNSGIMKLSQAVGIIMGANIGTTVTAWVLSLTGIESSNFLIRFLKPASFSSLLAMIGIVLFLFSKKEKKKDIGSILIGFAVLMFGMEAMSGAVKPLADVPEFTNILTMFSNPVLGVLAGAALTGIIQSSSASVGILQALSMTGTMTFGTALPIIMGQNIGTCVTAMLSSIGANKNAKRAALVHLYFNLVGTLVFLALFYGTNAFVHYSFVGNIANPAGIAIVHSIFNIFATVLLLPFTKVLEKLAYLTIKEEETDKNDFQLLDSRFLATPAFAIEQCKNIAVNMANISKETLGKAIQLTSEYKESVAKEILELENKVDEYEDVLGTYLVQISSKNLSAKDSQTLSLLLHSIGDFERIADHAVNITEAVKEMEEKKLSFSEKAKEELQVFAEALKEIVTISIDAFEREDIDSAKTVEPLEEVIDFLNDELKKRHIKRLRNGKCTIELGFILSEITTNYERVADHCSNIAVCLIQTKENNFDTHEYLRTLKNMENQDFTKQIQVYKDKYLLP